jgi:hypothetical protein
MHFQPLARAGIAHQKRQFHALSGLWAVPTPTKF